MSDIDNKVIEIVNDLNKKIDEISLLGENADGDKLAKINDIKHKAIGVLTQASNKINDTVNSAANSEELENGIEVVKLRSKQLYEDAVNKIEKLMHEEKVEEVKEFVEEAKSDIDEFFDKEEIKNAINSAKDVTVEVGEKAVKCLKEWLKPEDK